MPAEHDPLDALRAAWQAQPLDDPEVDVTELQTAARRFERAIRRRNVVEWIAVGAVIALFAPLALVSDLHVVSRVGAAGVCVAALWVGGVLAARGGVAPAPDPALDTRRFVEAHRASLLAQAELLRGVPRWYVAPLVLGWAVMLAGFGLQGGLRPVAIAGVPGVIVIAGVLWANHRAARQLRERAAALPQLDDDA